MIKMYAVIIIIKHHVNADSDFSWLFENEN